MKQKSDVLWVEDAARNDLADFTAPVIIDGAYNLIIAEDVSSGITRLLQQPFAAIIVDIRLPPGTDREWIDLYEKQNNNGRKSVPSRLGLDFLYTILGHPKARITLSDRRPKWITPQKIGVLSIESRVELEHDLAELQITIFQQKKADTPETVLLEMIKRVTAQAA
jgi:hypothetical protein